MRFFPFVRNSRPGGGGGGGANRKFLALEVDPPLDNVLPMTTGGQNGGQNLKFSIEEPGPSTEEPGPSIEEPGPTIEEPGP